MAAARGARARGIKTVLSAAPARTLSPDMAALVDILGFNAVGAEMVGAQHICCLPSAVEAARHLGARFECVIVTAGSLGLAALGADDAAFALAAEQVSVVSSHGAGDAFVGTLSARLVAGDAVAEACAAAPHAAALHVSAPRG